jgi:hypothetical protein
MASAGGSVVRLVALAMVAFAIATAILYWKSQHGRTLTTSQIEMQQERRSAVQAYRRASPDLDATTAYESQAVSPDPQNDQVNYRSKMISPPDLGSDFIPESVLDFLRGIDLSLQLKKRPGVEDYSRVEYWTKRKSETDEEAPDQWSQDMEARLLQFFKSHREATRVDVNVICRPSQCILRIVDTIVISQDPKSRGYFYVDAGIGYRPDGVGIGGVLWSLREQLWFKQNLRVDSDRHVNQGFGDYEFWLVRLQPVKTALPEQ